MSLKEIIKELLYINPKDDISKRYLSTNYSNYRYLLSRNEKKKFNPTELTEEELVQEFTFTELMNAGEGHTSCKLSQFSFSNISFGSTHIRDLHDFDLKVISKLAMLELLARSEFGNVLYKNVNQTEEVQFDKGFKQLDLSSILTADKDFTGLEIKIPFVLAIMLDKICIEGLCIEGIFRKSVAETTLKGLYGELSLLLNGDSNTVDKVYKLLRNVDVEILASLLKIFLRNIKFLIPTNIVKLLLGVPDTLEPTKAILFYQCLMLQIIEPNRIILEVILDLLSKLIENQKSNKIDLYNAATLFAPVLFSFSDHESNKSIIKVLQQMIHYKQLIFLVPRNVIKVYRTDNELNDVRFEAVKCIGKSNKTSKCESIVLCDYKHYGDIYQDEVDSPKLLNNDFTFKYKKQTKYYSFDEDSKISDLLKDVDESVMPSQLRLVENSGNICQCSLHPETKLKTVLQENSGGFFSVFTVTEADIVKSTMQELYLLLGVSFRK